MKRFLLFFTVITASLVATAQLSVSGDHLKMSDVIEYYKKYQQPFRNNQSDPDRKRTGLANEKFQEKLENKDYQFDRWKWYWQQHLDANGYLVSPIKTFNSWKAYQERDAASRITSTSGANWVFQGDDSSGADGSGVGRIDVIAFHPTIANTYWIGSAGGGAWKTTNNGVTWTNMTNQLPLLSVSDIKFNPLNPNTMYLCTGDRDGSDYFSVGLLKSTNGGSSWNNTGITWNEYQMHLANAILVNPVDTNSLIFASDSGIYRSFNGGTTWTHPVILGNFMQLLYNPSDTNIVYATSNFNYSSSASAQIYRSNDGGNTWIQVTSFSNAIRITLAVTRANVAIVKAIVAVATGSAQNGLDGIYNSTDTGNSYTEIFIPADCSFGFDNLLAFNADGSQCGGQGYYDLTLAIDPANANNVFCGGVNAWYSMDGGMSWQIMNQWSNMLTGVPTIHADKHFMGFHPLVPGRFFETNDGGIYWSDGAAVSGIWNNVTNGLGITEFYRVAVSGPATYEIAGAQDVGTKYLQNFQYQDADGGDGMECQMDPVDSTTFYASSEYGNIDALSTVSGWLGTISNNIPGTPTGGWITPYIIEPTCHTCLFAGYQDVYQSPDGGNTWTDISGPLTSGDLLRVVTTTADSNTLFAADDGSNKLFYTHNRGTTGWTTLNAPYSGQNISDVIVDPRNADKIWVAFSGYASFGSPQIVEYNETTNIWTHYNTNLPDVPVNCLQLDKNTRTLYAGTEVGVFYRDTTMTQWQPYTTGMPVISVTDLQFNYVTGKLWAATFGRGLWSSPIHTLGPSGVTNVTSKPQNITIQPNPSHGNFTVSLNNAANGEAISIYIIDNIGNAVWKGSGNVQNAALDVSTTGMAAGDYILEVSGATGLLGRQKIVVY